jgi:TPR repeat protein
VAASGLRYGTETHRLVNNDDLSYHTEEEDVVQYWKYSAEAGDPSAQVLSYAFNLMPPRWSLVVSEANCMFRGAAGWFVRGAIRNQVTMGTLHLQGAYGVEQNYELAREYFVRAADQGDLGGLANLGFLYAKVQQEGLRVERATNAKQMPDPTRTQTLVLPGRDTEWSKTTKRP